MNTLHLAVPFTLALLLPACGGSGGGGGAPATSVTLQLAQPVGRPSTNADEFLVRGRASSPDDVVAITVAGVPATSSDGFATWSAMVPLERGDNQLPVIAEDGAGRSGEVARPVVRRIVSLLDSIGGYGLSLDGQRHFFTDGDTKALIAVERATGIQQVVSQGGSLSAPGRLCFDPSGTFAYISELASDSVVEVLLSTGAQRVVSSNPNNPSGPQLTSPTDMVYDLGHGPARLILLDQALDGVLAVAIDSGARTWISRAGDRGTGPAFDFVRGICWSGPDTVLVGDPIGDSIFEVNVVTGDRVIVSSDQVGSGQTLADPAALVPAGTPGEFLCADGNSGRLFRLNRDTGVRTLVADRIGENAWFQPRALAIDPVDNSALVVDLGLDAVYRVCVDGSRSLEYAERVGTGSPVSSLREMRFDPALERLILSGTSPSRVVALDPATGNREVLWTDGDPGPRLLNPFPMCVVTPGQRHVVTSGGEFYSLDLATRTMAPLSPDDPAFGPQLAGGILSLTHDQTTGLLLCTDGATLFSIDTDTGQRQLRSPVGLLTRANGIAVDPQGNWIYVLNRGNQELLAARFLDLQGEVLPGIFSFQTFNPNMQGSEEGIRLEPGGAALLVGQRTGVIRLDLTTGAREVITGPDGAGVVGSGLQFISGGFDTLTLLPSGGMAVIDPFTDAVHLVDPTTGDRGVIAR